MTRLVSGLALCSLLTFSTFAQADPTITVGHHWLLPNTSGQAIEINVDGGYEVQGVNFHAQIGDSGSASAPVISDIDLISGAVFEYNNTGILDNESDFGVDFPQFEMRSTTTTPGTTVITTGRLATLVLDTTGFTNGTWTLNLGATLNGPTDFAGIAVQITEGTITIIPEPSTLVVMTAIGSLLLKRRQ